MLDLDQSIMERHSTRMFLPRPVPRRLLERKGGPTACCRATHEA